MCWFSKTKPVLQIAEEDIHVKKVLNVFNGLITSPVQSSTTWKLGVLYSTWLQKSPGCSSLGVYTLWKGFHSCKDIVKIGIFWSNPISAVPLFGRDDEADRIYDAIIPKGASYYESENGDYISNQLIIVKPL